MSIEPEQSQATRERAIPVDSFGNRLMLARAHAGHISIREAADLCDLGRGAWTNWEKGARPVDILDIAAVVADKLGVDRDWLLFGGPLSDVEPRSLRRIIRTPGRQATADYPALTVRPTKAASHPRNRPGGPSSSTRPPTGRRTARLPRDKAA
ncbi:MAG: hypothetical protein JWO11_4452 [Nocardioides sp.]|nr:hypothetical protein [Nocardioides sp.]